jgi:hypothetical protein
VLSTAKRWERLLAYWGLRKKPVEFSIWADVLKIDGRELADFHGVVTDENVHRLDFAGRPVLIVENAETFLALRGELEDFVVVLGAGDKSATLGFLKEAARGRILYWGDLDQAGFEALSTLRRALPAVQSVMMDATTVERFSHLAQQIAQARTSAPSLELLTPTEGEAFRAVVDGGLRIEHEQIELGWAIGEIREAIAYADGDLA